MTSEVFGLFLWALAACESGWDADAVGKCGGTGILQITPIMMRDCNEIVGEERWVRADCFDIIESYEMAGVYYERRCPDMTAFEMARCWQGGPTGNLKPWTAEQAERVCNLMWDAGRKRGIEL